MVLMGYSAFPQSSRISAALISDSLVFYPRDLLGESYPPQSMYSAAPTEWATLVGLGLTPRQRYSWCILQLLLTGLHLLGCVLVLCRDAVRVFCCFCPLGHTRWIGSYPSAEMQFVYSAASAHWATHVGLGLTPLQRCSLCILQLLPTGPHSLGWVLPVCRDAVGVFCSSCPLGRNVREILTSSAT